MTPELKYARALVNEALERMVDERSVRGAAWRLADALGWIARLHPSAPGIAEFTGLGNKLETNYALKQTHDP